MPIPSPSYVPGWSSIVQYPGHPEYPDNGGMIVTLGDWAQRAPDDMLNKMQMDCAQWRLLPAWLKPRQFDLLDIGPYGTLTDRGVTPNERRPIVPTLSGATPLTSRTRSGFSTITAA